MRKAVDIQVILVGMLCWALTLFCVGCGREQAEAGAGTVIVFAAASTTNAVMDIAAKFKEETGMEVVTNFASASTLAQQIEAGADVDVFISANEKWGDYLEERELCVVRKTIVGNRIVIVAAADTGRTVESPEFLLDEAVQTVAMGDPEHVPAGIYGKEALARLGLWESVAGKVTAAKDVRSALAYVETGAAEAGIVYSTDAAISAKVRVVYQFPADATARPIAYPALMIKNAVNPEGAREFLAFLESETARAVFREYGFLID